MLCIFFHAKHALNNTQVVKKVSDLDLTVISYPIGISLKGIQSNNMSDWEITLIDQAESVDNLRRRESSWQYEFDTFQPNGLNECDVALF